MMICSSTLAQRQLFCSSWHSSFWCAKTKEKGIWIYGADIEGKDYSYNVDFGGPCAIVIGSEGKGISNLTLKKCDVLVKIPMIGKINSLNASVAGGIMMYEVLKGRITK